MTNYTKITADSVKKEFSEKLKRYIGPKAPISYKQAARELEIEERTLSSWVRGEKQITLSSIVKLSLYLPKEFTRAAMRIGRQFNHK